MLKVGAIIIKKYKDAPVCELRQFKVGQRITLFDDATKEKTALAEILETDENEARCKIITTYGHRRHHAPAKAQAANVR